MPLPRKPLLTGRLRLLAAGAGMALAGCATAGPSSTPAPPTLASNQSAVVCPTPPIHAPVAVPPRRFSAAPGSVIDSKQGYCAYIATIRGVISVRLRPEFVPHAVNDFVYLARQGFYDGLSFDPVCPRAGDPRCPAAAPIAVAGDPTGTGAGGPGYSVAAEKVIGTYLIGAVAMYGPDPSRIGSQFFISKGDSRSLPPRYVIFGQVTDGIVALALLQKGDRILWVAVTATAPEP